MHVILRLSKYTVRNTAFHTLPRTIQKITWNRNSQFKFKRGNYINDQKCIQFL